MFHTFVFSFLPNNFFFQECSIKVISAHFILKCEDKNSKAHQNHGADFPRKDCYTDTGLKESHTRTFKYVVVWEKSH